MEYNIVKEAIYCLCCYIFKWIEKKHGGSLDVFVVKGFSNWKRKEKLQEHVSGHNSTYNKVWNNCQVLMNRQQHIRTLVNKQNDHA